MLRKIDIRDLPYEEKNPLHLLPLSHRSWASRVLLYYLGHHVDLWQVLIRVVLDFDIGKGVLFCITYDRAD